MSVFSFHKLELSHISGLPGGPLFVCESIVVTLYHPRYIPRYNVQITHGRSSIYPLQGITLFV